MSVDGLLRRLTALKLPGCANPYREADEDPELDAPGAAAHRRGNLTVYLQERSGAPLLLVGEAMGYRGGRFSGIAFTAERTLGSWGPPFRSSSTRPGGWAEPSGTIVHGALAEAGAERLTVLWNSVPAHPHRPGQPLTNRAPTRAEVEAGLPLLDSVIALVRPERIVAVGRTAERALGDRAEASVRHPAQGGARAFREGIARLLG